MKLWEVLKKLRENDQENLRNHKQKLEDKAYDEYNRINAMHRLLLKEKGEIIDKIEKENFLIKNENKGLLTEKVKIEEREYQFTKKLSENNRIIQVMKKKINFLASENEKLLYKIESKSPTQRFLHKELSENNKKAQFSKKHDIFSSQNADNFPSPNLNNSQNHDNYPSQNHDIFPNHHKNDEILPSSNDHDKNLIISSENNDKKSHFSSESSQSSKSSLKFEEEFEQTLLDLNKMAITSIPLQARSEQFHDISTSIDFSLKSLYMKDETIQTELVLMTEIYDKVMINNKNCNEMAEDFFYKKEVEEEEFMKILNENCDKMEKNEKKTNKEELEKIQKKLKEYRDKHRTYSVIKEKEQGLAEKLKGALMKIKAIRGLTSKDEGDEEEKDEEIDKFMTKESKIEEIRAFHKEKFEEKSNENFNEKSYEKSNEKSNENFNEKSNENFNEKSKENFNEKSKDNENLKEKENKEYETEEEESENEAKDDEKRQNIILKELNHETSSENSSKNSLVAEGFI